MRLIFVVRLPHENILKMNVSQKNGILCLEVLHVAGTLGKAERIERMKKFRANIPTLHESRIEMGRPA